MVDLPPLQVSARSNAPARRFSAVPVVVALVLGATAGLIWGLWAPGVQGIVTRHGTGYYDGQTDNFFLAVVGFVVLSLVGGLATGALVFRSGRRSVVGVWIAVGSGALAVILATALGQAIAGARYVGPGGLGSEFTKAPTLRLGGSELLGHADAAATGVFPWLASWVVLIVWPAATALWCLAAAATAGPAHLDEPADDPLDEIGAPVPDGASTPGTVDPAAR
ncbi:hypothetical protein [Tsukamurella soli]|uniref:DUF2567 domain-containing protein n=1 Tax=Tsukamurella soli TaxID=644556 RepID=A0ABP8KFF2_9ACTN